MPKEVRCILQSSEQRAALQPLCDTDVNADASGAIGAGEGHVEVPRRLPDVEGSVVMLAWEQAPAREDCGHRIAIAARNVHAGLTAAGPVPFDGDAVRGVLGAHPRPAGHPAGP